jgi:hypothetical protein
MKYILLSADCNPSVYLVPSELEDNLSKYISLFYEWLAKSPQAEKYRIEDGLCFNETDFVQYLNDNFFSETPLVFIETLELNGVEENIPEKYSECVRYNF